MFHDPWFYTTLLLLVGYITFMALAYWKLKPFMHILRVSQLGRKHDSSQPFTPVGNSSLREKLYGAKDRP
jgi:hypothetical protein